MEAPEVCPQCKGPAMVITKGVQWIAMCADFQCGYLGGFGDDALAQVSAMASEVGLQGKFVVFERKPSN